MSVTNFINEENLTMIQGVNGITPRRLDDTKGPKGRKCQVKVSLMSSSNRLLFIVLSPSANED